MTVLPLLTFLLPIIVLVSTLTSAPFSTVKVALPLLPTPSTLVFRDVLSSLRDTDPILFSISPIDTVSEIVVLAPFSATKSPMPTSPTFKFLVLIAVSVPLAFTLPLLPVSVARARVSLASNLPVLIISAPVPLYPNATTSAVKVEPLVTVNVSSTPTLLGKAVVVPSS